MRCKFCQETWTTKNRRGTKSRFSFTATLWWSFWILVACFAFYKMGVLTFGVGRKDSAPVKVEAIEENAKEAPPNTSTDVGAQADVGSDSNAEGKVPIDPGTLMIEE